MPGALMPTETNLEGMRKLVIGSEGALEDMVHPFLQI